MKDWVGVDFDGTLAKQTYNNELGKPVPKMITRIKNHLKNGDEVRVLTARACYPNEIPKIKAWCKRYLGRELKVTDKKDPEMRLLYDDKVRQVIPNTGEIVGEGAYGEL